MEIDATKILKDKLKIAGPDRKPVEIMLRYERLGNFCCFYAYIGHETRACPELLEDMAQGVKREEKIGPWIKADQVERRIGEEKSAPENHTKEAGNSSNTGKRKPTHVRVY